MNEDINFSIVIDYLGSNSDSSSPASSSESVWSASRKLHPPLSINASGSCNNGEIWAIYQGQSYHRACVLTSLIDLRMFFQFKLTFDSKNFISIDVSQSCMKITCMAEFVLSKSILYQVSAWCYRRVYLDCFKGLWRNRVNSCNFFV